MLMLGHDPLGFDAATRAGRDGLTKPKPVHAAVNVTEIASLAGLAPSIPTRFVPGEGRW